MDSCIVLWDIYTTFFHKNLNQATNPFGDTAKVQASSPAQIGPFYISYIYRPSKRTCYFILIFMKKCSLYISKHDTTVLFLLTFYICHFPFAIAVMQVIHAFDSSQVYFQSSFLEKA